MMERTGLSPDTQMPPTGFMQAGGLEPQVAAASYQRTREMTLDEETKAAVEAQLAAEGGSGTPPEESKGGAT